MWELIEELEYDGTTVLLTTQYLDEADRLAARIVVIDAGRVIAQGSSDELKAQIGGDQLSVTIASAANRERATDALRPLTTGPISADVAELGGQLRVHAAVRSDDRNVPRAIRALDDAGVDVLDVEVRKPTLDDVFLRLTGRRAGGDSTGDVEHGGSAGGPDGGSAGGSDGGPDGGSAGGSDGGSASAAEGAA